MTIVEGIQLLLERMTPQQAMLALGLSGTPTKAVIQKAWKKLAFKHHPDRGGDPEMMVKINNARDTLLSMGTASSSRPSARPARPQRPSPPPPQEAPEPPDPGGESTLRAAWSKVPTGVEWLFQSALMRPKPKYIHEPFLHTRSADGAIIYGRTATHHVFVAVSRISNSTDYGMGRAKKRKLGYDVIVMPSPIAVDLRKVGLTSIKALVDHLGVETISKRMKFVRWVEGSEKKEDRLFYPRGTSFSFKDIVDIVDPQEPGPATGGKKRKHAVEVEGKRFFGFGDSGEKEEYDERDRAFASFNSQATSMKWHFTVDGKEMRELTIKEQQKLMAARWFRKAYAGKKYFGQKMNITRKTGAGKAYGAKELFEELVKHLDSGGLKKKIQDTLDAIG